MQNNGNGKLQKKKIAGGTMSLRQSENVATFLQIRSGKL